MLRGLFDNITGSHNRILRETNPEVADIKVTDSKGTNQETDPKGRFSFFNKLVKMEV